MPQADLRNSLRILNIDIPDQHFNELVTLFVVPGKPNAFMYTKFLAWVRTNTEKPHGH